MPPVVNKYLDQIFRMINQMETTHWIIAGVFVLVVGIACMRGMNTRM
jgi:hypothetical protein